MSEPKVRRCDEHDCPVPATHKLVWSSWQYYCALHANAALNIAAKMGFPKPARTVVQLEPDEMILDEEPDES